MPTVQRTERKGNARRLLAVEAGGETSGITARVAPIQALIPLDLDALAEELQHEVEALAAKPHPRQGRQPAVVRWGEQRGSVYLADQKLPVVVPQVRDRLRISAQVVHPFRSMSDTRAGAGLPYCRPLHS